MSLSRETRLQKLAEALILLVKRAEGDCFMGVFIDERFLPTEIHEAIWDELKERGFVRETNSKWSYTLSGYGWITGMKVLAQLETEEMEQKAGKLAAALKERVKGRHHDNFVAVSELAQETGLTEHFIRDAIESDLIGELFGRRGAEWAGPFDRGRNIRIPKRFGLEPV